MERETARGFQYHAALPYQTESHSDAIAELDKIVNRLCNLQKSGELHHYEFGTAYAHHAALATRDLLNWTRRKLDVPLETKIKLTDLFLDACLTSVEPALFVRYGAAALLLWKNRTSQQQLRHAKLPFVDYAKLVRCVRNAAILADVPVETSKPGDIMTSTPASIARRLAWRFGRLASNVDLCLLDDEIMCLLGPAGHEPVQSLVVEALCALLPYGTTSHMDLLLKVWKRVSEETAAKYILPGVAECVKCSITSKDTLTGNAHIAKQSGVNSGVVGDEFLDMIFQVILHTLQLPLAQKGKKSKKRGADTKAFATLVVYSTTPHDVRALERLDALTNAALSFCHPSNVGVWTGVIVNVLLDIIRTYVERLNSEEEQGIAKENRLTVEITERFVGIVKTTLQMSIHSQNPYVFSHAQDALRLAALLSPHQIVPHLLGEVYPTLQHGLHQPQRLITSIACLVHVAQPLTQQPPYKMHLTTLLELSLPNLDTNDTKRCFLTISLFLTVASLCEFRDISDCETQVYAAQVLPDCVHALEESDDVKIEEDVAVRVAQGTSGAFPELLSMFLRRIFELLESMPEARLGSTASAAVLRVLLACSPAIFDRLLNIMLGEIMNPQQLSHDSFAQVCGAFVRANCFVAFPKLWNVLVANIREEIMENQAGSQRVLLPKDSMLLRYLSVLNMCLLAANASLLMEVQAELREILVLLRERTNVSVVYTVANTVHHAISALIAPSILFPNPKNEAFAPVVDTVKTAEFMNLKWNVSNVKSRELAAQLFVEHVELSERAIQGSIDAADKNIHEEDVVSNALIFIRTATGSIAPIANTNKLVKEKRRHVAKLLSTIYHKLSRDDISVLKEVLFVAKVWLCDVRYERTARLDTHQLNLYQYEKQPFDIPGGHKRGLPPAVMARRAQLSHHQRMALATQHRKCDEDSRMIIFDILLDACFSAYPAVRRNAFSALYSPLKIFADMDLYGEVYGKVLDLIEQNLDAEEYERAEGGFMLLKYRSFGMHTVGRHPQYIKRFLQVCMRAGQVEHRQLYMLTTSMFFILLPDSLRLGTSTPLLENPAWPYVSEFVEMLLSQPLNSLHWREAMLRASALFVFSQIARVPLDPRILKWQLEGTLGDHPDVRLVSLLGSLTTLQTAFRYGLVGYSFDTYAADGPVEVSYIVEQSRDSHKLENDLSSFIKRSPLPVTRLTKSQPRPSANLLKFGAQATEPSTGFWRINSEEEIGLIQLTEPDFNGLHEAMAALNTQEYWKNYIDMRKVEPRPEEDKLGRASALFIRNMAAMSCLQFGEPIEHTLESVLVTSSEEDLADKNWHRVAAEVVCGLIMALPMGSEQRINQLVMRILSPQVIASLSSETVNYWAAAIAFAMPNVDYRRFKPLLNMFEEISSPHTSSDGGGIKLSLRMTLHSETMAAVGRKREQLSEVYKHWEHWNHGLQTIRESAADEISISAISASPWPHPTESRSDLIELSDSMTSQLVSLFNIEGETKADISLLGLIQHLLHALGGDACATILIERGFPLLLRLSAVREDPEVVVLVTNVFAELSTTEFSHRSIDKMTKLVIKTTHSELWHQRMRMLLFLQSFFFNHLLILKHEQRQQLAMLTVVSLADQQAEVRELAADTLSGIVRCSPLDEQEQYVKQLTSKFIKKIGTATTLVDRHATVLGLGALIGAFPYTSPPPHWIPKVLALLALHAAGDSGIVGKSAKSVLSDFKKTRQDTWHIDQMAFSQEQLDDLDGVLWRNYFA